MGTFDNAFGVALVGTWLATILAGVGLTQAVRYFAKFPNDILFKKALVGVVLFLLFLELAMECAEIYLRVVTGWGNPIAFTRVTWPLAIVIPCTFLIGGIVNQFLVYRFYGLSNNIWVAGVLSLLNLASFVVGIYTVVLFASKVGQTVTLAELNEHIAPATFAWSIVSVVADFGIAGSLVWTLRGMRTSYKDTNQLIQHITAVCIQNGLSTSAMTLGGTIAHSVAPATKIDDFFLSLVGPLYLVTLLSNLTLRDSAPLSRGWASSGQIITSHNSKIVFEGVQVPPTGVPSTDLEATSDGTTIRGTSDDVGTGARESEDRICACQNAEKI
ncbi:hypothetical protein C8R46DRAFT_1342547 [Mycena filopes]|nr:hypothetical protein C8R46DRAFT_1342547 [Mycena filopes]